MRKVVIHVPESRSLRGVSVSYESFVRHLCDTDDRFKRTAAGIRAAVRIELTIDRDRSIHLLEEADWAPLKQAAEAPSDGYPRLIELTKLGEFVQWHSAARACIDFVDAISNATPHECDDLAGAIQSASASAPAPPSPAPAPPHPLPPYPAAKA